jgi:hypothetical protein
LPGSWPHASLLLDHALGLLRVDANEEMMGLDVTTVESSALYVCHYLVLCFGACDTFLFFVLFCFFFTAVSWLFWWHAQVLHDKCKVACSMGVVFAQAVIFQHQPY